MTEAQQQVLRLAALAQDFACGLPLLTPTREPRACRGPRLRSRREAAQLIIKCTP